MLTWVPGLGARPLSLLSSIVNSSHLSRAPHRALVTRQELRRSQQTGHPKVNHLDDHLKTRVQAIADKAHRLQLRGRITSDCEIAVGQALGDLQVDFKQSVLQQGLCAATSF